jgi:hypothetical protein
MAHGWKSVETGGTARLKFGFSGAARSFLARRLHIIYSASTGISTHSTKTGIPLHPNP